MGELYGVLDHEHSSAAAPVGASIRLSLLLIRQKCVFLLEHVREN